MAVRRAGDDVGTQAAPEKAPRLCLRELEIEVFAGPDVGRKARVVTPTFVVGSGEEADLRLTDAKVSRQHLTLAPREDGVRLRDSASKNGTWLGAVRIGDAFVATDVLVILGESTLALRLGAETSDLPLSAETRFGDAVGVSLSMRNVFALLERAAKSNISVLLEGESGVGKDVLARALHAASSRRAAPFVAVDCGALPQALIESELFGHEKGAFTGATRAQSGLFRRADKGTLFLDEIGELPADAQAKLLRVLEAREVRPVGGTVAHRIDVRIVAATNRRLAEASQRGEFRKDLYYRLSTARITVPPLRDRPEDVLPLARAFLRSATGDDQADLSPELSLVLAAYHWPGNVRELRNVIERHAFLGLRSPRALLDAPEGTEAPGEPSDDLSSKPYLAARRIALERFERSYLPKVLERAGGAVARAAELARVTRPSFYRMLERAGLARHR